MITIFDLYSGGINGTNTSMIDLYFFLRDKFDVKLAYKLSTPNDFRNLLDDFHKNFCESHLGIINEFVKSRIDNTNTIITNFYTLTQTDIKLYCDKLIILDSAGVMNYKEFPMENIYANKIIFFGNPSNDLFEDIDFVEYYHKFSSDRLEYIMDKFTPISKSLTTKLNFDEEDYCHVVQFKKYFNKYNKSINNYDFSHLKNSYTTYPHGCSSFLYQRWYEIQPNVFIENIGKLIFEFLYFNKFVYYSCKNKSIDDGLHHYLSLFNIDDSIDQSLNISPYDIEQKLVYNNDDFILELL